jgi:glycogen debranching enzyme
MILRPRVYPFSRPERIAEWIEHLLERRRTTTDARELRELTDSIQTAKEWLVDSTRFYDSTPVIHRFER